MLCKIFLLYYFFYYIHSVSLFSIIFCSLFINFYKAILNIFNNNISNNETIFIPINIHAINIPTFIVIFKYLLIIELSFVWIINEIITTVIFVVVYKLLLLNIRI